MSMTTRGAAKRTRSAVSGGPSGTAPADGPSLGIKVDIAQGLPGAGVRRFRVGLPWKVTDLVALLQDNLEISVEEVDVTYRGGKSASTSSEFLLLLSEDGLAAALDKHASQQGSRYFRVHVTRRKFKRQKVMRGMLDGDDLPVATVMGSAEEDELLSLVIDGDDALLRGSVGSRSVSRSASPYSGPGNPSLPVALPTGVRAPGAPGMVPNVKAEGALVNNGAAVGGGGPNASLPHPGFQMNFKDMMSSLTALPVTPLAEGAPKPAQGGSNQVQVGEPTLLRDIFRGRPILVHLLRRYGCGMCRDNARDLSRLKPSLDAYGVGLLAIGRGMKGLGPFVQSRFWRGEMVVDPTGDIFDAFGCNNRGSIFGLLHPQVIAAAFTTSHIGDPTAEGGDLFALAGTFVMSKRGKVLFEQRQKTFADFADLQRLLTACKQAAKLALTDDDEEG